VPLEVSTHSFAHPPSADAHRPIGGDGLAGLFHVDMDFYNNSLQLQRSPDQFGWISDSDFEWYFFPAKDAEIMVTYPSFAFI
jgi:hypothetical protein